jgi:hypothetical protein
MKLREQLKEVLNDPIDVLKIKQNKSIDACEKIADTHAIGFANYISESWFRDSDNIGWCHLVLDDWKTTEQLLENYKQTL